MSKKNAATIDDVAKALGCTTKGAQSRLVALGYVKVCGRCGGSGRYSYNQMDGDRCYGCRGAGKVLMPITAAIVAEAKARQDDGELDLYVAHSRAIAAAKAQVAPLVAEAEAVYKTIADAYTRAGKVSAKAGGYINDGLWRAQDMNNTLFWGPDRGGRPAGDLFSSDAVQHVEYRATKGRENALSAVAKLRERIADLTALRDSAAPHIEAWIAAPKAMDEAA